LRKATLLAVRVGVVAEMAAAATRASRRLTEKAPKPRSSTRSSCNSAVAISSKIAVMTGSTSRR
jgi:hypothetical protein